MKFSYFFITFFAGALLLFGAEEPKKTPHSEHSHGVDSKINQPNTNETHSEKEGHNGHEDVNEEAESKVGLGKGVEAIDEELGIKFSPQAIKNFEVKTIRIESLPVIIPNTSLLFLADDVEIFRLREGYFKRIDFKKLSISPLRINSPDLKAGDEIVTDGVGFLRIAEISASGGAPEGHSH